jgi:hypothetical protein
VGIFFLFIIDTFVFLAHEFPKGAITATSTDLLVWAILIACYLIPIAVAMYPGRAEPSPGEWRDFDPCPGLGPSSADS